MNARRLSVYLGCCALAALLVGCSSDSDDVVSPPVTSPGPGTYTGVVSGAESGIIVITVLSFSVSPAASLAPAPPVSGSFTTSGGSVISLSGVFDEQTGEIELSGGSGPSICPNGATYCFSGVSSSDGFSGTWDGPSGGGTWEAGLTPSNLRGSYAGTTTFDMDTTTCDAPASISLTASLELSSQTGSQFFGTVVNTTVLDQAEFSERMHLLGIIAADGRISGTFDEELFVNGGFESSGSGTFDGQFGGSTLAFSFEGQDTVGDTCEYTGRTSLTRLPASAD